MEIENTNGLKIILNVDIVITRKTRPEWLYFPLSFYGIDSHCVLQIVAKCSFYYLMQPFGLSTSNKNNMHLTHIERLPHFLCNMFLRV